jgi:hypothetical protein
MGKIEPIVAADDDDKHDVPDWHIEAIREADRDPRPSIPAEEFFADMHRMIADIVAKA